MVVIKKRINSFTLIELIVVMMIIGILAVISMPVLSRMIEKSRQAEAIDILTRMYKGFRVLVTDEIVDAGTAGFINGTLPYYFNPDESDSCCNPPGRSGSGWSALGFPQNPNEQYNNLYFSYDFLKKGESSPTRDSSLGSPPGVPNNSNGIHWGIAYRKLSNNRLANKLFPVDFNKRIYIYMNNGTIVKSSDY